MRTLLFSLHCVITLTLIGVILLQKSGSGGLASGGGSQGPRSAFDGIGKFTAILGTVFVLNCLLLTGWVKWEIREAQTILGAVRTS